MKVSTLLTINDAVYATTEGGQIELPHKKIYFNSVAGNDFMRTCTPDNPSGYAFYSTTPLGSHTSLPDNTSNMLYYGFEVASQPRPYVAIDIETSGLGKEDEIEKLGVWVKEEGAEYGVIMEEEDALPAFLMLIDAVSPAFIVGHNLFKFDIPFMKRRWEAKGWGEFPFRSIGIRYRVGTQTEEVQRWQYTGNWKCTAIDTYLLAMRVDAITGGDFESYGLKELVTQLGLRGNRQGERYHLTQNKLVYLANDLLDTIALYEYLDTGMVGMLPVSHDDNTMGMGQMINALCCMLFAPYAPVPEKDERVEYRGGMADILRYGFFKPVYSLDVVSMYPNIMIRYCVPRWCKHSDWFSGVVRYVLQKRLEAKEKMKRDPRWKPKQFSLKILANSFYGFLACGMNYSDIQQAQLVTEKGRETVLRMAEIIEEEGGQPIEIDTDGVYFFTEDSPERIKQRVEEETGFKTELTAYDAGLFVKIKNYVLWRDGKPLPSGSAIRNRRDTALVRHIIDEIVRVYAEEEDVEAGIRRLWDRCVKEYSLLPASSGKRRWYEGGDDGNDREVKIMTLKERLDNLSKLYNVFMRFGSLKEFNFVRYWRRQDLKRQIESLLQGSLF